MVRSLAILAITAVTLSSNSLSAKSYAYSLKNYSVPAKGCLSADEISLQQAEDVLKSQNLGITGATNEEVRTAGAAIKWLQHLNGGVIATGRWDGKKPYNFRVQSGTGNSAQRADHILIRRNGGKQYGLSVAQFVHEYAHFIGNRGAYGEYRAYMKGHGYCLVSGYADNNPNEQFAEVFTGFATDPEVLTKNDRSPKACKRAFEFFKNWFGKGSRVSQCL